MKKIVLLSVFFVYSAVLYAQIIITPTPDSLQIATMLQGSNVSITNLTINGDSIAYGLIDAEFNPIFYGQGFAITNADINDITGPNNTGGTGGADLYLPGDTDLTVIMGVESFDATVIEFDISTSSDTLLFYYVFGSEEYPENVDGVVNDGFGVFISGDGINGPYINNAKNFALIPGTFSPISINDLNNGANDCMDGGPIGPCSHCEFYVNNCSGMTFQYDGFTTLLEGTVPVTQGEIYHVKLAIADGFDGFWDSGVLFPAGAFRTTKLDFTGIENYQFENVFNLYPNPASTSITIQTTAITKPQTLKIINVQGQLVFSSIFDIQHSIFDISQLPTGLYHLLLEDEQGRVVGKKLVVAR